MPVAMAKARAMRSLQFHSSARTSALSMLIVAMASMALRKSPSLAR